MNEEQIDSFASDDDDTPPRAFTSDEEREAMANAKGEAGEQAASEGAIAAAATEPTQTSWGDVIEASAAEEEKKRPKKREKTVLIAGVKHVLQKDERTDVLFKDVELSSAEFMVHGRRLANLGHEITAAEEELRSESKVKRGKIEEKKQERKKIEDVLSRGKEPRQVECAVIRDDRLGEMVWKSLETGEVVDRQPMDYAQRQMGLPEPDPDSTDIVPPAAVVAAAEKEGRVRRGRKKKGEANGAVAP
jgi:hypothetical protein